MRKVLDAKQEKSRISQGATLDKRKRFCQEKNWPKSRKSMECNNFLTCFAFLIYARTSSTNSRPGVLKDSSIQR